MAVEEIDRASVHIDGTSPMRGGGEA